METKANKGRNSLLKIRLYGTSGVYGKWFKQGVDSFTVNDKINFRSGFIYPVHFLQSDYKVYTQYN